MRTYGYYFVWLLFLSPGGHGEPYLTNNIRQPISICAEEWPDFTNKDGSGLFLELLDAVYAPTDIELSHIFMPWKRTIHEVAAGKADIAIGVYKSDKASKTEVALLKSIYPIIEERIEAVSLHEAAKT